MNEQNVINTKEIIFNEIISLDQDSLFYPNMDFDPNLGFVPINEL